jgi:hypothetical protein
MIELKKCVRELLSTRTLKKQNALAVVNMDLKNAEYAMLRELPYTNSVPYLPESIAAKIEFCCIIVMLLSSSLKRESQLRVESPFRGSLSG